MNTLIATSSNLINSTLGFTMADLVTFVGNQLLLILGGGLGLVQATIGWVIALGVVGMIIGLIYKTLRYLHIFG